MCGICGFNWEDTPLLNGILKEIEHRGIDGCGKFTNKEISLGHRRLSIIDLSKAGKQPMSNENQDIWIVFNGEIYNFKELREELEQKGHKFKSNTDTEVIIHLYEQEGFNCLNKMNGMFAFCIYDSKKNILFLARDRVGIKPVYYYNNSVENRGEFMFCSEIKGILKNKEIERRVNLDAVSSFLSFRANTNEETCFKSIYKLMPGHYLTYNLKQKQICEIKKYWDISFKTEDRSEKYFTQGLKRLLFDSVKRQIISDVPFGAYLSGGVDSGTIVSIMSKLHEKPIETFSVGFENESDEINESKFLANSLNTHHHELIIKDDSVKYLPKIVHHLDEPMSDPTCIPIYLLSKYTKRYCTVVLTGEGSDELFAGYPQYKFMKLHKHFIRPLPQVFRKPIVALAEKSPKKLLNKGFKFASELGEKGMERFSNFVNTNNFSKQYLNQVAIFNEEEKKELLFNYSENFYNQYSPYFLTSSIVNNCTNLDFKGNMADDLLMKMDKNTMAFSVEARVPFLDHRIIQFASKIPDNLKLRGFTGDKFILREAMKGFIPEQTRKRKKKHFFVPINYWFKNELLQLKEDLLSKQYLDKQGIFKYSYIDKIHKNFKSSNLFYSRQLWSLISFQIWHKLYIENEKIRI